MDYIKGICFLVFFITFIYHLGKTLCKNSSSYGYNFLVGYIVYTVLQALGGIVVQYFKIDYAIYQGYMIVIVLLLIGFIVYKKEFDYQHIKENIIQHFKKYYMFYGISLILLLLNLMAVNYLWLGNHQDDGWYLLKVAQAPYLHGNYDINYATGFSSPLGLVRTLNTFELDYAFWSHLLGIYPSIFCKAIMSFFNYYLILVAFSAFIDYLPIKENKFKYFLLLPILFFSLQSETLSNHGLLTQQDGWHFSSAIWYGSTLVRCITPIVLFLPITNHQKIDWKYFIWFIFCGIAMVSKSSQALPIMGVMAICIVIYYIWNLDFPKSYRILPILFLLTMMIFLPHVQAYKEIYNYLYVDGQMKTYFTSPVIILALVVIIASVPFVYKERYTRVWLSILVGIYIFIFVPYLNTLFLDLAFYTFVAGRTLTLLVFYTVLTACFFFGVILSKLNVHKLVLPILYVGLACGILGVYSISYYRNIGFSNFVNTITHNTKLVPESSVELSKELDDLAVGKNKELNVISISWVSSYHNSHALCTSLRINSTHIHPLAAIHRFPDMDQNIIYHDFDLDRQLEFETFLQYPNDPKSKKYLKHLLNDYPTDVMVTADETSAQVIQSDFGYKLYKVMNFSGEDFSYYILINSDIAN